MYERQRTRVCVLSEGYNLLIWICNRTVPRDVLPHYGLHDMAARVYAQEVSHFQVASAILRLGKFAIFVSLIISFSRIASCPRAKFISLLYLTVVVFIVSFSLWFGLG